MIRVAQHKVKILLLLIMALASIAGIACRSEPEEAASTEARNQVVYEERTISGTELSSGQSGSPIRQLGRSIHGDPRTNLGVRVGAIFLPPEDIQDFVNRADAVVTGTISAIGAAVREGPYNNSQDSEQLTQAGYPSPGITVTYYTIALEEILLDDGNIASNPLLRLGGHHSEWHPQVGERFLVAIDVNPDGKSYGIVEDWNLIPLGDGPIRNFDGTSPGYTGVTDEPSLKDAVKAAVPNRVYLPVQQWPKTSFLVNENAPAETPQAPGGDDSGDTGPAGNASE